jgi:sugar phosphate isomerase/epimerase
LKLSLSNGIFCKLTLEENLATIKGLGFENIEFNMKTVKKENDTYVYAAKKLVEAYGLNCLTLHAATLYVKDEVEIHRAVYYGKISADFAHKLSAPTMVVHSNVSRKLPKEQRNKFLAKIFKEIKTYAESLSLKLALENLSYASTGFAKNVAEIEEMLGVVDDGTMGLTLDFCHAIASGTTLSILEKYHERLCNVHISNRIHKPLTEQTPALKAFVTSLSEFGYEGPLTIELSRKCTTEDILRTKSVLEETLNQVTTLTR